MTQERSGPRHAIEARIYAEDPDKGFLPATGISAAGASPRASGIRVDTGFRAGDQVSPYYDPMLAKLIVQADDRRLALARMAQALAQFQIAGVDDQSQVSQSAAWSIRKSRAARSILNSLNGKFPP